MALDELADTRRGGLTAESLQRYLQEVGAWAETEAAAAEAAAAAVARTGPTWRKTGPAGSDLAGAEAEA